MRLKINIHFLEPFRLIEWHEQDRRNKGNSRWQRGQSFARWHRRKDNDQGRPYITGTLLRSVVIRAVEEELARPDTAWQSCGGLFITPDGQTKPQHLRHRATVRARQTAKDKCADRQSACPFCLLLGRFDQVGKDGDKKGEGLRFDVRFSNLDLPKDFSPRDFDGPQEIGSRRTINRVDDETGKAHDFFSIWEVDAVREFQGEIVLAADLPSRDQVESLLHHALGFVDRLCGARCVISIADQKPAEREERTVAAGDEKATIADYDQVKGLPYTRLRPLADAVRNLRQLDLAELNKPDGKFLPPGRVNKDGRRVPHYVWDIPLGKGDTLRKRLEFLAASCEGDQAKWRNICESEGQALYEKSKKLKDSPAAPGRHLGAAEQVRPPQPPVSYSEESINSDLPLAEWIITGTLRAETPFAIGMDAPIDDDQTSSRTLVDRDGRYRLPRSTLRGILRRDLSLASGDQGCQVRLGPERPCTCPVCLILRQVVIADTVSETTVPADIRQRIRRNPITGTAADGGLFDTERGPKGAGFPFSLRYRGHAPMPKALRTVLQWWSAGKCFAGSDGGVGCGRFALDNLEVYRWDLGTFAFRQAYSENNGLRSPEEEFDLAVIHELAEGLAKEDGQKILKGTEPFTCWQERSWQFSFTGPLLQGDPLAALNSDTADIISFRRTVVDNGEVLREPVLRGEGLRGLLRTAVGRVAGDDLLTRSHQDCKCEICQLFGSEHRAGILRFEDLPPVSPTTVADKRLDHVAIDRFDQSVVEKYDDRPLVGSPKQPLVFKGCFWVQTSGMTHQLTELLAQAWRDIAAGHYPVGGKGGIGYGWINSLVVDGEKITCRPDGDSISLTTVTGDIPPRPALTPPAGAIYYPHYFLPPNPEHKPKRSDKIIGHHTFATDPDSFTGRITCKLEVVTPLIVPDTEGEQPKDQHKNFPFFKINDEIMLPGAPLWAAVSQVYEALTNSCFRVMKQKRFLSWRMEAEDYKDFYPGRVLDGGKQIKKMGDKAIRMPLYDDSTATGSIKDDQLISDCCPKSDEKLQKALATNQKIALAAKHNQEYLAQLSPDEREEALQGLKKVSFWTESLANNEAPPFLIAKLGEERGKPKRAGYLKITGPNNANIANTNNPDDGGYIPSWKDQFDYSFRLLGPPRCLPNTKGNREYPRPGFTCVIDGKEYSLTKRCERIFEDISGGENQVVRAVTERVREQYREILASYRANAAGIAEGFRTRMYDTEELRENDLVYFKTAKQADGKERVVAISPVCISREADDRPLGKRLPAGFQPCSHVCLEDCNTCSAKNCPVPLYREGWPVNGLCPACRLFGAQMYKGRVNFGFARLPDDKQPETKTLTLPLLERPRPTWVLPKSVKGSNTEDATIPGRKFYLRHDGWRIVMAGTNPITGESIEKTANNATVEAIMPGATFTFDIVCENLDQQELGLLLYSLELEEGMSHTLGRGKPLGFGNVRIKVEKIEKRLSDGSRREMIPPKGAGLFMTDKVQDALRGLTEGGDWHQRPHISGLRRLLTRYPEIKARYPKLSQGEDKEPGYIELKSQKDENGVPIYNPNRELRVSENGPLPWFLLAKK